MEPDALLFEAVIVPHRSLSPRALLGLLGAVGVLCCITTGAALIEGAWPIGAFAGVELGLAGFLFHLNARRARAAELLLLTERGLRLIRTDARGERQERLIAPDWLRVRLVEGAGKVPRLTLVARGVDEEVGRCLGETEKRELAAALEQALDRWRHPRFDNPQLRE